MGERFANMVELGEASFRRFAGRPLFGTKRGSEWVWTRYEDFTTANDMLTPTLKLKRRNVLAKYRGVLESLYGAPATPVARTGT